jgi:hypothetical protein
MTTIAIKPIINRTISSHQKSGSTGMSTCNTNKTIHLDSIKWE